MPYEFKLTTRLPANPQDVFDAWMSSEGHTAMTGGLAHVGTEVGTSFDAWDGYISGKTIELEPGKRIRQTWRTAHFSAEDEDSIIGVELKQDGDVTILTLTHQFSYEKLAFHLADSRFRSRFNRRVRTRMASTKS